jgi:hypothetical protein
MNQVPASEQTAQRVERLLRSLIGVADLRPAWDRSGRLGQVHILKDDQVQHHQLTRNVVSALQAGFGIRLDSLNVSIYAEAPLFAAAVAQVRSYPAVESDTRAGHGAANGVPAAAADAGAARAVTAPTEAAVPAEAVMPAGPLKHDVSAAPQASATAAVHRNGVAPGGAAVTVLHAPSNGNGSARHANGNGQPAGENVKHATASSRHLDEASCGTASASESMVLERLDVERHSGALRCHVVLSLGAHRYSAIAEVPDGPAVEAELAATVTLDALRAGALTCARLEGVGFTSIGDTTYLVAAIRESTGTTKRASAAPLVGSMARSAALAVLSAVGPITAARQLAAERQLGRL